MAMSVFFRPAQAALVTRPTVFIAALQGDGVAKAVSADSSIQSPVWSELPESILAARNLRFSRFDRDLSAPELPSSNRYLHSHAPKLMGR
ncbi:hypothetical protein RHGRI_029776 [Rhododendron griersonianum]|uniref:Uncharacterized protein n=1 Tax=Rhododendron griersonianum TaxID=479676 RepID=A0AAV6IKM4_9ERIC|nr:hypothetical protein RHGRI_029776 [Rhododendron griersonianum]